MKYRKPFYNSFLALAALSAFSNQTNYAEEPDDRPNILWITCEDISPNLGCYGDTVSKTPFLDKLASEGIRYTNAFSCAGVCAPQGLAIFLAGLSGLAGGGESVAAYLQLVAALEDVGEREEAVATAGGIRWVFWVASSIISSGKPLATSLSGWC